MRPSARIRRARSASAAPSSPAASRHEPSAGLTLLEVVLETGRTHQIRVHLESIGHPVLGDVLYGGGDALFLAFVAHVKGGGDPRAFPGRPCARQMLHASALELAHPRDGRPLRFASELPAEMGEALA
jgi:23S rRNA pseudouridine1911/1915/1917 synthase